MTSPLDFQSLPDFLNQTLREKKQRNTRYSLNSLARSMDVSSSYLSRIIHRQRHPSTVFISKLSRSLQLTPEETVHILKLAELDETTGKTRKILLREVLQNQRKKVRVIQDDQFKTIADWYHFAILSLAQTRQFKDNPAWISKRLGISEEQASSALKRLYEQKLMIKSGNQFRVVEGGDIQTNHDMISLAVQENHKQHLRLAEKALENIPIELREFANTSIPMNLSDTKLAKKKIRQFLDRFIRDMEKSPGHEVFQFNLQFYMLSQVDKEKK